MKGDYISEGLNIVPFVYFADLDYCLVEIGNNAVDLMAVFSVDSNAVHFDGDQLVTVWAWGESGGFAIVHDQELRISEH